MPFRAKFGGAILIACLAVLLGFASRAAADPLPTCGFLPATPATIPHVIWIMLENKSFSEIFDTYAASAPYENQLATECGVAANFWGVTHPSLPNYIAATSGSNWGIADNGYPDEHQLDVPSIFSQVTTLPGGWRSYQESMIDNCQNYDTGVRPDFYQPYHNPGMYYSGLHDECLQWDVPLGLTTAGNLASDLDSGTLPAFAFITPNQRNNMHSSTPIDDESHRIANGDTWLSQWIPRITSSLAYQTGQLVVFITWDEDDYSSGCHGPNMCGGHIPTFVISPYTAARTLSTTEFGLYSLLRTTEELLGISQYLEYANTATSMRSDFGLMPLVPTAVEVRSASATRTRRGMTVSWQTASDVSILGFNVYRQTVGKLFRLNRRLIAARSSSSGATFRFVDQAPKGPNRYWIKAVDLQGKGTWHGPIKPT